MSVLSNVIAVLAFFIMPTNTTLYDNSFNAIVTLPAGYFVLQSDAVAPDGYIAVIYDDLTGYVRASDVRAVDYVPVNKYETTVTFTCDNDGQPVNLRAAPQKNADILKVLDRNASGHSYGTARGEALIKNGDTLWYYVNANGVRGYCYYAHVSVSATPPNIIEKEPDEPDEPTSGDIDEPPDASPQPMPTTAVIVLIVALCIPVPFVIFYMFKKPKEN